MFNCPDCGSSTGDEMSGVGIEWRERESYETSVDFVSIGRAEFRPVSED